MSILCNETAYARGLRASAAATRLALMERGMSEEIRPGWGELRRAILDALDDRPRSAAELAIRAGKPVTSISPVLHRLEAGGLALRFGPAQSGSGHPASLWVLAEARR